MINASITKSFALLLLAVVCGPSPLESQRRRPGPPRTGQVVRWDTMSGQRGAGRIAEDYEPGSGILILCPQFKSCTSGFDPVDPDTLDLSTVGSLEVQVRDGTVRGAKIGGLVGVLVLGSLALGLSGLNDSGPNTLEYAIGVTVGSLPFALVGALIGNTADVWRPLRMERDFR